VIEIIIKNKEWIFSGIGVALIGGVISVIRILLRKRSRMKSKSISHTTKISKDRQKDKTNYTIGEEDKLIIESLKNITAPNEALSINEISERVGLDIPTATYFLNQLKESNIVNGPYVMGEGRRYLLTDRGFQIYYEINKSKKENLTINLPKWLTGEDVMRYYNLSSDLLMQYVRKGLPVYPAGEDVIFLDEEVPPLNEEALAFEIDNNDYSNYRFKRPDIERFIKAKIT
jgi:predicted transcriptional regulator